MYSPKKICTVFPTHNRSELLREHLLALNEQTIGTNRFECVVVGDLCTDDTAQMVQDLIESGEVEYGLKYVETRRMRHGITRAINLGVRQTCSPIIHLTGDDCIPEPDCFAKMLPKLGRPPGRRIRRLGGRSVIGRVKGETFWQKGQEKADSGWIDQAHEALLKKADWRNYHCTNVLLWRKDFIMAGRYDEDLIYWGFENIDLGKRLQDKCHLEFVYVPEAVVYHIDRDYSGDAMRVEEKHYQSDLNLAILRRKGRPLPV